MGVTEVISSEDYAYTFVEVSNTRGLLFFGFKANSSSIEPPYFN